MFSRVPDLDFSIQISILNQKIATKLLEIWSEMFISVTDFFPSWIPDPGAKKAPDLQHW